MCYCTARSLKNSHTILIMILKLNESFWFELTAQNFIIISSLRERVLFFYDHYYCIYTRFYNCRSYNRNRNWYNLIHMLTVCFSHFSLCLCYKYIVVVISNMYYSFCLWCYVRNKIRYMENYIKLQWITICNEYCENWIRECITLIIFQVEICVGRIYFSHKHLMVVCYCCLSMFVITHQ